MNIARPCTEKVGSYEWNVGKPDKQLIMSEDVGHDSFTLLLIKANNATNESKVKPSF